MECRISNIQLLISKLEEEQIKEFNNTGNYSKFAIEISNLKELLH